MKKRVLLLLPLFLGACSDGGESPIIKIEKLSVKVDSDNNSVEGEDYANKMDNLPTLKVGDEVEAPIAVDYRDIPHFKVSTAPGHKGRLVFGLLEGQRVAVMQGRMHHYEGYSYEEVSYAVRVLRLLG